VTNDEAFAGVDENNIRDMFDLLKLVKRVIKKGYYVTCGVM